MLNKLLLPNIMDTSTHNLAQDFFIPALSNSIFYDRGVGFFSSAWLRINCQGMIEFASNGGRARWVTSPILDEHDWDALLKGSNARCDPILYAILNEEIKTLATSIEKDTLTALAWMVADEIITFKIALPYEKLDQGDFHDKFGIFTDIQGNKVSFNGSYNDSIQGMRNYESIKIFCSWQSAFAPLALSDQQRFDRLWNNNDPNVRVFDLPEAAREKILRLRTGERPYKLPQLDHQSHEYKPLYISVRPSFPRNIYLRDYQEEAIEAWFSNGNQGILEMATGTGKTITALALSVRLYQRQKRIAMIITVPYQHLVDQWNSEARMFGYKPVLAYKSKSDWFQELNEQIIEYNGHYREHIAVITTHTTFSSPIFQSCISRLKSGGLLVADEAHHLGAESRKHNYPQHITSRVALSATPDRWFDDQGTEALRDYFGKTVFTFPLEKAIGTYLTPYYYYPQLVSLTDEEMEQYIEFSKKIAKLANSKDETKQKALEMLLIRRSNLLNNAENKLSVLSNLIDKQDHINHSLVYCTPEQIKDVLQLLGLGKGLLVHRFTANENTKKRQELLSDFASGKLQALVAIKCLDEGVDVPNTNTAYLIASNSNPREFIQRRGRILRKAPGKEYSNIYDLIAVPTAIPNQLRDSPAFELERKIVRRELQRFKEFANLARNKYQAIETVWSMAAKYDLIDF